MSSSGVKSYVDSNYVPLSATQAPVTGLTDILTPVNLLPNSDFSRSGGYASSQTYNEIVADWATLNYAISLNTYFQVESGVDKITNVTITRSANKINVKATLGTFDTSAHQNGPTLRLRIIGPRYSANRPYTLHCVIKDNLHPENSQIFVEMGGTRQLIYNNNNGTMIIKGLGTENDYYMKIAFTNYSSGDSIDFDYIEGAIYEGSFKNPPVTTSLDVKSGNQFALSDGSNIHLGSTDILSSVNKSIYEKSGNIRLNFDTKNNTLGTNVQIPIFYDYLDYAWKAMSVYLRIKFDEFGTYGRTYSRYYDAYYFIASNNPVTGNQYEVKTITPGILQSIASSIDGGETTVGLRKIKWNNTTNHETGILLTLSNIVYRSSGGIAINIDYQFFTQSGLNTTYIYPNLNWLSWNRSNQ